jgi:hypothetical protein
MGWDLYLASDHKIVPGWILSPLLGARIGLFVGPSGLATLFFWSAGQHPLGACVTDGLTIVNVLLILYLLGAYAVMGRLWKKSVDAYCFEPSPTDHRRNGKPLKPIL